VVKDSTNGNVLYAVFGAEFFVDYNIDCVMPPPTEAKYKTHEAGEYVSPCGANTPEALAKQAELEAKEAEEKRKAEEVAKKAREAKEAAAAALKKKQEDEAAALKKK